MCMAEATPRLSAKWRPSHTFAAELHQVADDKPLVNETVEEKV